MGGHRPAGRGSVYAWLSLDWNAPEHSAPLCSSDMQDAGHSVAQPRKSGGPTDRADMPSRDRLVFGPLIDVDLDERLARLGGPSSIRIHTFYPQMSMESDDPGHYAGHCRGCSMVSSGG